MHMCCFIDARSYTAHAFLHDLNIQAVSITHNL
jgi:hypothetical protein